MPSAPDVTTVPQAPAARVGVAWSWSLAATGDPAPTWTATDLPAGITLSAAGALAGTPTTAGTYTVTATATNGSGTDAVQFQIIVAAAAVVTVADLQDYLQQTIPADRTASAQAALDFAQAAVESYCRRTFDGTEPDVGAVAGVVVAVAGRRYLDPAQRQSYNGPGPDGYNYTPAVPGQIMSGQEMATLDRFRRVVVPKSISSTAGLP